MTWGTDYTAPTKLVLGNEPGEIQSGRLESALPSTDSATAAFGLEGAPASAGIESTTTTTTAGVARGTWSAFSRFVQSQFSAC